MVNESKLKRRIAELVQQITYHNRRYYTDDTPDINDFEYDTLVKELTYLEETYPHLKLPDSPLQRVGGEVREGFSKVEHQEVMLSLNNTYTKEDIRSFVERLIKLLSQELENIGPIVFVAELKMDGLAVALRYREGKLITALTRGDGHIGEDVSLNVKTIKEVPLSIDAQDELEIRGEVFLNKKELARVNKEREEMGDSVFANTRNAAAGSLRQLDSSLAAQRQLRFFPYGMVYPEKMGITSQSQVLDWLTGQGFSVNPHRLVTSDLDELIAFCQEWEQRRENLPFEVDGIVIKVSQFEFQQILGATAKAPRWAVAYKFSERSAETVVDDITFQVGRQGTITPVASLRPVEIGGVMVQKATLHNFDFITEKGMGIGDSVLIKRAGDVIPAVVLVTQRPPTRIELQLPTNCPVCETALVRDNGQVAWVCPNLGCAGRVKAQVLYVISRDVLNIDGMGEKLVDQMLSQHLISHWIDLFRLTADQLLSLERMGEISVVNILRQLEAARQLPFSKIISAFGIRFVGERTAQLIADHLVQAEDLEKMSVEELQQIEGVGEKSAQTIVDFFSQNTHCHLIDELKQLGFSLSLHKSTKSDLLSGKLIVVTGSLQQYTRSQIEALIKDHQGKVSKTVSKKIDFLITGESPGSKLEKAEKLGIPRITETEFEALISRS